jgi:hypothetical protein
VSQLHTLIFLNLGALLPLPSFLSAGQYSGGPEAGLSLPPQCTLHVIDSHRPWNLENLFATSELLSRICIWDDGAIEQHLSREHEAYSRLEFEVSDSESDSDRGSESEDEESDEGDDADDLLPSDDDEDGEQRPAQRKRRRLASGSSHTADEDEDEDAEASSSEAPVSRRAGCRAYAMLTVPCSQEGGGGAKSASLRVRLRPCSLSTARCWRDTTPAARATASRSRLWCGSWLTASDGPRTRQCGECT